GGPRRGARGGDTGGGAGAADGTRARRKREPIEAKESYRWLEGYRRACAVAAAVPGTRIVSISDREGDIYECLAEAQTIEGPRADWIIRSLPGSEHDDALGPGGDLRQAAPDGGGPARAGPAEDPGAAVGRPAGAGGDGDGPLGERRAEAPLPARSRAAGGDGQRGADPRGVGAGGGRADRVAAVDRPG